MTEADREAFTRLISSMIAATSLYHSQQIALKPSERDPFFTTRLNDWVNAIERGRVALFGENIPPLNYDFCKVARIPA